MGGFVGGVGVGGFVGGGFVGGWVGGAGVGGPLASMVVSWQDLKCSPGTPPLLVIHHHCMLQCAQVKF